MGLMALVAAEAWAACNSPNGTNVTVEITAPAESPVAQLTMAGTDTNLTSLAATESGDDDDKLTWTFEGFVFPDGNTGASVEVDTPPEWPYDNSLWGEKDVTLTYDGGIEGEVGDCEAGVKVKVFFDPLAEIGDVPAWFKYWRGSAVTSPGNLAYTGDLESVVTEMPKDAWGVCKGSLRADVTEVEQSTGQITGIDLSVTCEIFLTDEVLEIKTGAKDDVDGMQEAVDHERGHEKALEQFVLDVSEEFEDRILSTEPPILYTDPDAGVRVREVLDEIIAELDADGDWIVDAEDDDVGGNGAEDLANENVGEFEADRDKDWSHEGANWI